MENSKLRSHAVLKPSYRAKLLKFFKICERRPRSGEVPYHSFIWQQKLAEYIGEGVNEGDVKDWIRNHNWIKKEAKLASQTQEAKLRQKSVKVKITRKKPKNQPLKKSKTTYTPKTFTPKTRLQNTNKNSFLVRKEEKEEDNIQPKPFVILAEDKEEDNSQPNPFVTPAEDEEEDNIQPNPFVTPAEDEDNSQPNSFVTPAKDEEEDNIQSNPFVTPAEHEEEDNIQPNPFVTPAEHEEDNIQPNPFVTPAEDEEEANIQPNPFVTPAEHEEDDMSPKDYYSYIQANPVLTPAEHAARFVKYYKIKFDKLKELTHFASTSDELKACLIQAKALYKYFEYCHIRDFHGPDNRIGTCVFKERHDKLEEIPVITIEDDPEEFKAEEV